MTSRRSLDIVVYGATGFVGQLLAAYLARSAPKEIRVGLGGRSRARLAHVREGLGAAAASWPLLEADAANPGALRALAEATHVIATTVGPYRRNGINLVEACVNAGTHYTDLTGEVLFIRESIDRFHDIAARKGVRIVHSCGFDSIPSDLGTLLLHQAVVADKAGDLEDTTLVVRALKGGISGGTLASGQLQADEARADPAVAKVVEDPYALSPDRSEEPDLGDEADLTGFARDEELKTWIGPFIMAGINTRAVRRSNALQGWAYGRRFRYREVTAFGNGLTAPVQAAAMSTGLRAVYAGMGFGPTRALINRVMPSPGEGPSEKLQREGFFKIEVHGRTSTGKRYVSKVSAKGDPGYAATAVMLGEAALCLALDGERLPRRGGVLTPSTGLGNPLVERLRVAGMTLEARAAEGDP